MKNKEIIFLVVAFILLIISIFANPFVDGKTANITWYFFIILLVIIIIIEAIQLLVKNFDISKHYSLLTKIELVLLVLGIISIIYDFVFAKTDSNIFPVIFVIFLILVLITSNLRNKS